METRRKKNAAAEAPTTKKEEPDRSKNNNKTMKQVKKESSSTAEMSDSDLKKLMGAGSLGRNGTFHTDKPKGVLSNLNMISIGQWDRRYLYEKQVRTALMEDNFSSMEPQPHCDFKFKMRITALSWHQGYPNIISAGSKHGDIMVGSVSKGNESMELIQKSEISGPGPGGSITAMKFDRHEPYTLYRTSIDSSVRRINFANESQSIIYHDFASYEKWFTSMDIDFNKKTLLAGDNTGNVFMFSLDGTSKGAFKMHKSKVHHIEFNLKDPNMFVTTSTGTSTNEDVVKLWDIRKINLCEPLYNLPHQGAVNIARFNPLNGSRLLTSDQKDEIRVYQGPFWDSDPLIIKHPHSQFQHITAIKADWHPLSDTIIIGRYPKDKAENKIIELYDADTGKQLGAIRPPDNKISSLNSFNPTGEFLASGVSAQLIIWKPVMELEDSYAAKRLGAVKNKTGGVSQEMKNRIRGGGSSAPRQRRRAEYSPANSDDDETDANEPRSKKVKREKKTATSTATSSTRARTTTTSKTTSKDASNAASNKKGRK